MNIGDKTRLLKKGDIYRVPPNVIHGGVTKGKVASIIEAFSPPRDYTKL
jgi:quercetin dioxygenase-like cupin family protein